MKVIISIWLLINPLIMFGQDSFDSSIFNQICEFLIENNTIYEKKCIVKSI